MMEVTPVLVVIQCSPDYIDGNPPLPWSIFRLNMSQPYAPDRKLEDYLHEQAVACLPQDAIPEYRVHGHWPKYVGLIQYRHDSGVIAYDLVYCIELKMRPRTNFDPHEASVLEHIGWVRYFFNRDEWDDELCEWKEGVENQAILCVIHERLKEREDLRKTASLLGRSAEHLL